MTEELSERHPLDQLGEEFVARYRRGERPSPSEFARRYPEWAGQIGELLQALVLMEELGPRPGETGAGSDPAAAAGPAPRQLGEYRILREIGRGGMGVVYEAEQESLGRHVALKVLPFHALMDARHLERFRREAKTAARLHHTNIVPVFGVGEQEGVYYYAMQFIQGQGLDEVLDEVKRLRQAKASAGGQTPGPSGKEDSPVRNPLTGQIAQALRSGHFQPAGANPAPASGGYALASGGCEPPGDCQDRGVDIPRSPDQPAPSSVVLPGHGELSALSESHRHYFRSVAQIGVQVAEALAYAHGQGVVHRDVKPSNLLLDARGTVWVTDFGLAKAEGMDDLTHRGDVVGTLRYMAPERFSGRSDARGDIYSLGLTLYELLTLRPAYEETNRSLLIRQVIQQEPPPPRRLDPRIPRDLETVVLKASAKEPAARYRTAADLAEDLRLFLAERPVTARRVTAAEQLWRWCRRNPALAGLAFAVMGLSLLLLMTALIGYLQTAAALGREGKQRQAAEEQRDRANDRLYLAQMQLARQAWEDGALPRLEELLAGQRPAADVPDLRGWEWYYLRALSRPELFRLRGHKDGVTSLDWSPDGRRLATSGQDGAVRVWDLERQQEQLTLSGHTSQVARVAWREDGRRLASTGLDGLIKVWDADTGRELRTWQGHKGTANWVAWDPAGQRLASAGFHDRLVKVWDAETGELISTFPEQKAGVRMVVWAPDGRRLAWGGDEQIVRVWDFAAGREVLTLHGYASGYGLAWRSQAPQLAFARTDNTIRLWDLDKGQEVAVLAGHRAAVGSLTWRRDGQRLSSHGLDNTIRIWDPERASELLTLRTPALSHAWSPDGTRLATGRTEGFVGVLDTTREPGSLILRGHKERIQAVAWSPDSRQVASAGRDQSVVIWDPRTGQRLVTFPEQAGPIQAVAWSPDGQHLATAGADKRVRLLSVPLRQEVGTLGNHDGPARAVAWNPDGQRVASAGEDRTIRLWDVAARRELRTLGGTGGLVRCLAWSPDGRWLASADDAQGHGAAAPRPAIKGGVVRAEVRLRVWDAATGEEVFTSAGHALRIDALAWAPDSGRLATASWDQTVKVWDLAERREVWTLRGHGSPVQAVAWGPDGRRLASAGADRAVRIWDLTTGQEILTLRGHANWVLALAWSPDGRRLASGSWDGTLRIWDASGGHELEQGAAGLPPLE